MRPQRQEHQLTRLLSELPHQRVDSQSRRTAQLAAPPHRQRRACHSMGEAHYSVELPADLIAPSHDIDTVDALSACLPRVLSELSPAKSRV